ncbi:lipopolysaccharide biosynthesis protein [Bifidobacterium leontopitheci]|uniref:Polysaccharide biosynthesis protein n=1 Tax=Bifidobacterium leontopitheci TaxID=2650774 RepID=A0A6I1GPK7_9BIFI|nr:oligosaccharide flippase family protein [Bifidobacterium leontopitheci]KAB7791217.1 Polysaccharide biosynthesis protein [Bifidobacterium leontopitheci]
MNRGLIANIISNISFFVCGYAIHFFLGGFASPANYGVVGTIITLLDFEYLFVSNGARQSIARNLSSRRYDGRSLILRTMVVQAGIVAVFFLIDFAGAPLFGMMLHDRTIERYFQYAAFLVPANGLYVVMLGINDGLQRFGRSALMSTLYPIVKLGTIPLIILLFPADPVLGLEIGYCSAMIVIIVLGCFLLAPVWPRIVADGRGKPRISWHDAAHGTLSFSLFFIMASLVLSADTFVVKSVLPDAMAGYYTGAMNFGKTTYYLLQAFAVILLPVSSRLIGQGRRAEALAKVRMLTTLAFAFVLPIAVIISASANDLLASFYSEHYTVAAPALSCLALSSFFMGVTVMLNMLLNAEKDTRFSDILSLASLVVVVAAFIVAARLGGIVAVAASSMVSTFLTMSVSYVQVRRRFGDVMTVHTWAAIGVNVVLWAAMYGVESLLHTRWFILLALVYLVMYVLYAGILFVTHVIDIKGVVASFTQHGTRVPAAAVQVKRA